MDLPDWTFFGNPLRAWLRALVITGVLLVTAKIVMAVVLRRLRRIAARTVNDVDDLVVAVLEGTRFSLLVVLALTAGLSTLQLPARLGAWIGTFAVGALLFQIAIWANRLIMLLLQRYQERSQDGDGARVTTVKAASFLVRVVLFSTAFLMALDNVPGLDITTLIASLGVGGIAVALALQNVLVDLLASLSIALDKPFVIGDYITIDGFMGTVEHIGLKTTRLRSLTGEQLVFGNHDLLGSRIRNFKRMTERRVLFGFGVLYQTSHEKLEAIPGLAREIVEAQPGVRFDRAHFKAFGNFSLDFEVVYYVLTPDYNSYMDTQQAINLALFRRFAEEGIEFAYPTQTLFVQQQGA